jgi:hypothetical protein
MPSENKSGGGNRPPIGAAARTLWTLSADADSLEPERPSIARRACATLMAIALLTAPLVLATSASGDSGAGDQLVGVKSGNSGHGGGHGHDDDDDSSGPGSGHGDDDDSTKTGTTRGTGKSDTGTKDTRTGTKTRDGTNTGTTKGTGKSNTGTKDTNTGTKTGQGTGTQTRTRTGH